MRQFLFAVILFACIGILAGPIEDLKPGEWYEVPNSHLASVPPGGNVIAPWSGGAFDTKRNQLFVWGGGHGDYAGNEVYVFNLDSLKWFRQTAPSSIVGYGGGCTNILPDSQPVSRHTYAGMDYMANIDMVFSGGGFTWPSACGDPVGWFFDYTQNKWVVGAIINYGSRGMAAYDPDSGRLWSLGGSMNGGGFRDYNPKTGLWTNHGTYPFGQILTVDPVDRLLVGLNKGSVQTWNIDSHGAVTTISTSGDTAAINASMPDGDYCTPGFVWDPILKCFVAWSGGADVYTLNLTTGVWTRVLPAATNTVTPTAACATGTYGRFRYSPKSNVYVVVNSRDQNVFIYRLAADPGTASETNMNGNKCFSFAVQPNPIHMGGQLSIRCSSKEGNVSILDISGRTVGRFSLSETSVWSVPVKGAAGLYLVRLTDNQGRSQVKPVVFTR